MRQMKKVGILMVVLLVVQMMLCFPVTAASEPKVATTATEAQDALVQVEYIYTDQEGNEYILQRGTGFFIDSSYVIAAYHVVSLAPNDLQACINYFGDYFAKNYKKQCSVRIILTKTASVKASITEASSSTEDADFAVLKLSTAVNINTVLALGKDEDVKEAQTVYSISFPGILRGWDSSEENSTGGDKSTTTSGIVERVFLEDGKRIVQHGAKYTNGSSGGPVVNDEGCVIGVGTDALPDENKLATYYFALAIGQVENNLVTFGIPYYGGEKGKPIPLGGNTGADEPAVCQHEWNEGTVENCITTKTCTLCGETTQDGPNHSFGEWSTVKEATKKEKGLQERECADCGETESRDLDMIVSEGLDPMMIAIIAVAAIAVILVIVIIVIASQKNKKQAMPAGRTGSRERTDAPTPPPVPVGSRMNPPMPFDPGAAGTTVLNEGAGETTVLNNGTATASCMLIRKKTGERIMISSADFVIGKERKRVNYCISDNPSVSRSHARIITRGNERFIADMNSTNYTTVNGLKLTPGIEHKLGNGDIIKLSDEEFEFMA